MTMKPAYMLIPALISLGATACTASDVESTAAPLTSKQAALLESSLKGRTAGKPVSCVSSSSTDSLIRVSDSIVLSRGPGSTVYVNNLRSACPGLARDNDIMVIETHGSGYCQGDLIRLVDRSSGMQGPVCSFGDFTPYRKHTG
jgi:hypothetical protein